MGWTGHVSVLEKKKNAYTALVRTPEGKNHLENLGVDGRTLMVFKFIGWKGLGWSDVVQNRDWWRALVNAVMNLRVP
jgi:hypothetical protein